MMCEHDMCLFLFLPTKTRHMSYAFHFSVFIPSVICIFVLNSNIIVVPMMIYDISTQIIYNMSHRKHPGNTKYVLDGHWFMEMYGNCRKQEESDGTFPNQRYPLSGLSYCSSLISSLAIPKLHIDFCVYIMYIYIHIYIYTMI